MAEYVVVKTYSFNSETEAAKFDDYRKAKAYLHWLWEDTYNTEIANDPSWVDESECYHDETYARIQFSDGDAIEFFLVEVEKERSDFPSDWERYVV